MPTGTSTAPGPLTVAIAAILRGELAKQRMTKTAFAERVGTVSRAQISKMLNGEKPIDIEDLDRMAFAVGRELKDLIKEAEALTPARFLEG